MFTFFDPVDGGPIIESNEILDDDRNGGGNVRIAQEARGGIQILRHEMLVVKNDWKMIFPGVRCS